MPTWFGYEYRNESPRIAAWKAHYMRKGCTDTKADLVAHRKCCRSNTWPPKINR